MANKKQRQINIELLTDLEISVLLEGMSDEELMRNPAFLTRVRNFLKDNGVMTPVENRDTVEREFRSVPTFDIVKDFDEGENGDERITVFK